MTSTTTPSQALPHFVFFLAFPGPGTMKFGVSGPKYGGGLKKGGRNTFPTTMIWTQGVRFSGRRNKNFEKGFTLRGLPPQYFWNKNNFEKKSQQTNKNQVLSISSNLGVGVLVSPDRQTPLGGRKGRWLRGSGVRV